jgi:hypothetical protein
MHFQCKKIYIFIEQNLSAFFRYTRIEYNFISKLCCKEEELFNLIPQVEFIKLSLQIEIDNIFVFVK